MARNIYLNLSTELLIVVTEEKVLNVVMTKRFQMLIIQTIMLNLEEDSITPHPKIQIAIINLEVLRKIILVLR